jgi:tetratricopeptide (TPR) repeat protein
VYELKQLSREGIPAALDKAMRYRKLNEPEQAESICLDVLAVDPDNQQALVTLVLALTDRFADPRPAPPQQARALLPRLNGEYERAYYAGIICERLALARLRSGFPAGGAMAFDLFREAMAHYEQAERLRPPANDDPILRWNSCARMIMAHPDVRPEAVPEMATVVGDD